jgi:hypothetical protein
MALRRAESTTPGTLDIVDDKEPLPSETLIVESEDDCI